VIIPQIAITRRVWRQLKIMSIIVLIILVNCSRFDERNAIQDSLSRYLIAYYGLIPMSRDFVLQKKFSKSEYLFLNSEKSVKKFSKDSAEYQRKMRLSNGLVEIGMLEKKDTLTTLYSEDLLDLKNLKFLDAILAIKFSMTSKGLKYYKRSRLTQGLSFMEFTPDIKTIIGPVVLKTDTVYEVEYSKRVTSTNSELSEFYINNFDTNYVIDNIKYIEVDSIIVKNGSFHVLLRSKHIIDYF